MADVEQYEIWAPNPTNNVWELVAGFPELEVATAVANARTTPVKLVHAFYEGSHRVREEVLAEMGSVRPKT